MLFIKIRTMKRSIFIVILAAIMALPSFALSVRKKSIKRLGDGTQTQVSGNAFKQIVDAYDANDLGTANELIRSYLKKNSNDAVGWAYQAIIQSELGNSREALKSMNKAKDLGVLDRDPNWFYYTRADINLEVGDTLSAIDDLTNALKYDPKDTDTYYQRAHLYRKLHMYDEAMVDYGYLVQLDPKEVEGYLGIGAIASAQNKREDAIKAFGMAIKLHPEDADNYALRATEYFNAYDYENSTKDVVSALEIDRGNKRALWVLNYLKEYAPDDVLKIFKKKAKKTKDNFWLDVLNVN